MKTEIINKTNQSFELKEGNAGAYRFLKQLDPGTKHSIKVDPNATYREYMVATGKKGESIFLTSDDFSEYKVIDIEEATGENGTVIYKSMTRNPRDKKSGPKAVVSNPPASSAAEVVSDPPASSAAGVISAPAASSAAAVGSAPAVSSAVGVESVRPASSTGSSKASKSERVPWYRKLVKSLVK